MAQIDIQEKKGTPAWAWILGLVALLVVIGLIWGAMGNGDDTATMMGQDTATVVEEPIAQVEEDLPEGAVEEYLEFGRQPPGADADMGLDHEYTETGLEHLIAALDEMVQGETVGQEPLQQRLGIIRERADAITQDPESLQHATWVSQAFTEAASLIEDVHGQRAAGEAVLDRHVEATREAADSIDPDTPLLDQRDTVRRFFSESSEALARLKAA